MRFFVCLALGFWPVGFLAGRFWQQPVLLFYCFPSSSLLYTPCAFLGTFGSFLSIHCFLSIKKQLIVRPNLLLFIFFILCKVSRSNLSLNIG